MTPLFRKLNLGVHTTILIHNSPESFESELAQLDGVKIVRKRSAKAKYPFAMGFAVTLAELNQLSRLLVDSTEGDAVVWVAFPKGSSKRYQCEFNRDSGWSVLEESGFETVRIVAIDEDWSALRFRRTEFVKR